MRHVGAVARRELASLFVSPVAYVVLTLYALLGGFFFFGGVVGFQQMVRQAQAYQAFDFLAQINLSDQLISPFLGTMTVVMIFVIPGITMGLFASEKTNGTDELLLTSPLTIWDIVFGKYLAAAAFVFLLALLSASFPAILFLYGNPDLGRTAGGILGLLCAGLTYAAIGSFASSVTRSQMIAFILAFVILLVLLLLGGLAEVGALGEADWLRHLAIGERPERMSQGLIDTSDLAYFAVGIGIALLLTKAAVESVRWR